MTNLADELAQRLQLAKDHGPLSDSREVYIPSSWLPELLASLTGEGEPVAWPDRPALDIPALQREVAGIIVRDVLQEEYDDLVEGYLDEIMRASLRIIRLPGYSVVARAFETNLADALLSGGGE